VNELTKFDDWLKEGGPAALVIREPLEPVEGPDGVFFPATYAPTEDKKTFLGGYNIDTYPDGTNVCLVDSVGSQANRIEPIFAKSEYAGLVPQVNIQAGEKKISLLEAGHRAGDAIVRCSELKNELHAAFKEVLKRNAEPLAKIAPTSLVFGVWDSRDTEVKLPRLVSSTIRAFNVKKLSRSANYLVQQQIDYTKEELIPLWESDKEKELYSKRGFLNALASASHGGVMLMPNGSIRRDATLNLAALRRLEAAVATDSQPTDKTQALRRYILGLSLVALTTIQDPYLRQGCNLVPADEGKFREFKIVLATGKRETCTMLPSDPITCSDAAKVYALAVAQAFSVGTDRNVVFDAKAAEKDIKGDSEKLKGAVVSLDAAEKKFKLKTGKGKDQKEIDVSTNDGTVFMKGKEGSTFDQIVVTGAKLEVEAANGVAVKVTGKR
jgi:CRISPR-associated protein Csb1